jgi:hypothetical protein
MSCEIPIADQAGYGARMLTVLCGNERIQVLA